METIKSVRVLGVKKRPRPPPCEEGAADGGRPSKARRVSPGPFGSARSAIQNYRNFINSGRPRRVLFFDDSGWRDFPEDVMLPLLDAFKALKSAVEISMRNCSYLVDFVHMVMTDLKTGEQQSVGYIDEAEKCFFPVVGFEDGDDKLSSSTNDEIKLTLEILIHGTDNSEPEEDKVISNAQLEEEEEVSSVIKEVIVENGTFIPNVLGFYGLGDKLVQMHRGDEGYNNVQKIFLTGLGVSVTPNNVLCIHRYAPKDGAARARLQSFEEQVQILQKHRGDANVRRGWYGTSKEGVVGILRNGFGRSEKPSVGMSYGAGVYLAPERCGHVSVKFCDVDENGVQHMVLCRIILGSMEKVQLGSEQFHPSSEDFDSGVDNIQNPRLYVIWNAHVNTRILPEYVVSFKLLPSQQEHLAGLNNVRTNVDVSMTNDQHATSTYNPVSAVQNTPVPTNVKFPTSAWLPFSMLFDAIQTSISPSDKELLDVHYNAFKCKKITREQLIQKLRQIAGDDLLRSTLRQFQCNPPAIVQSAQQKPMHKGTVT